MGDCVRAIDRLVDSLHAKPPVRAWSLIATFYGDAIAPRGGEVWLGTITELMAALRVDERAVRAAMSRLARDGWLERAKIGRLSYYGLSETGHATFAEATERIYKSGRKTDAEGWRLVLLVDGDVRAGQKERLARSGFGQFAPNVMIGAASTPLPSGFEGQGAAVLLGKLELGDEGDLVGRAFDLIPLSVRYQAFLDRYRPLVKALERSDPPEGLEAMVARTLLIHDYRRIVLRDPRLPARLLPADWRGHEAEALCAALYKRLLAPSDAWLKSAASSRKGRLPAPNRDYDKRFSS
ncbi:phenylacetic acid degradation operon negative regulatory protein PaaX [Stappia sp. F7233]|uniref:Phenylacetic acid degradation operon negative regulatory protein PaaX n=1 Tax=Stappia albiluteola TaxID=2758565 RepID=A0A839AI49_9HYPH|nr:PaaX family transcriptional regulator C-terminal domain-containing protein [Stappia albiluteola]MBA5779393.1 phenylacetic acid degradation operon negative regulatory protein PaaX [Stappia albiluteola]